MPVRYKNWNNIYVIYEAHKLYSSLHAGWTKGDKKVVCNQEEQCFQIVELERWNLKL
jgi:hypothetical protein